MNIAERKKPCDLQEDDATNRGALVIVRGPSGCGMLSVWTMSIAYTMAPGKGDMDLLLYGLAAKLSAAGHRLCGTVQINTEGCIGGHCDMDLQVLPNGPVLRISQSLGTDSRGCRLDPNVLEQAIGLVEAGLAEGADALIVNKFGKHEADGRGFRSAIAAAVASEIPVIVGLNAINRQSFIEFVGDTAEAVPFSEEDLISWFDTQRLVAETAD